MVNDPMRILKADHREVEKLLGKLADSEEGPEREQMVEELVTKLSAHMQAEESIVYPPIKSNVGEEDEEEAEVEHGLAREGLEKVQQMVEMPGFGAAVEMLEGGIKHHVEEEETQLLPELKESLERDEWLAIGDALVEAKQAAGLPAPQAPRRRPTKRTKSKARS
jgi:hemerythrin-like domain-containing protein